MTLLRPLDHRAICLGLHHLNRLGELNKMTLTWIIMNWRNGREKENPVSRIIGVPFASRRKAGIKSWLERGHLSFWRGAKGCCWSKQLMKCLQSNRTKDPLALKRGKLRIGIRLLTNHVSLKTLAQVRICRAKGIQIVREGERG